MPTKTKSPKKLTRRTRTITNIRKTRKKLPTAKVMRPEVKALWIDALRSGEYVQGDGALKETTIGVDETPTESYCCLGVLCDLYAKTRKNGSKFIDTPYIYNPERTITKFQTNDGDTERSFLPDSVAKWAGLPVYKDDPDAENEQAILADMNDNGHDFKQIANFISKNL